ncbi:50S ribosomal protein L4 [Candidatus Peregrinibacteria bacterium]|nr:MAG: 50S ribosomal protein L4 [Candidatus Peregrinibacteria bacterium]
MKAPLYNQTGEKTGDITLVKEIFEIEGAEGLVHSYLVYQQANARRPIAHVLTKGDVRGGGKKPFAQKHTGRARQGSIRNPHMRGGGNAFGPKKWQNFEKMMNKGMRRKALFQILSSKAKDGKVLALDKFELDAPKTKTFSMLVEKLPVERNVLVVRSRDEKTLFLSSRNFARGKTILGNYLNPADLLKYDNVLFTSAALKDLETTYTK